MNKKKNIITFAAFLILMVGLGANDAMRGIFSTIFSAHFQLSTAQLSQIVTVSYIGNLVFLAVGGFGVDILGRRKAMLLYTFLWSAAMLLFATTDSYLLLLVGMFFAMGTSTLLNTNMNLITTGMFAVAPGFFVNFLFFIQGIGTSGSQSIIGNWATDISSWHTVHGVCWPLAQWHGAVRAVPHAGSAGAQNGGEGIAQGDHELSGISVVGADHRPVFHCRTWHYELAGELCYQCTGSAHGTGGKLYRCFLRLCDGGASGAEQSGG